MSNWSEIFRPDNGRPQIFSHGGGTQGTAIVALIVQGRLPKPDAAVIADTGREASQTWDMWENTTRPALEEIGVPCHRIPHSFDGSGYNTIDIWTGKHGNTVAMPMFTPAADGSGKESQLPKYCSNEWKRRPIERYLKRALGYTEADLWIGYSLDEATSRAKHMSEAKFRDSYPLIEVGMSRGDCKALVESMGWGKAPRSACWMCPYRSKSEWVDLKENWPRDFEAAVKLERHIQKHDPNAYFHRSLKPLDQIEWSEVSDETYEPGCQSGLCFT